METIIYWVTAHKYFGILSLLTLGIVGLPIPDEMLLIFSGYLVSKGELKTLPTIISAFSGSVIGMSMSYLAGRFFGKHIIKIKTGFLPDFEEMLPRIQKWFNKFGKWTLIIGYFIPGVRHFTAFAAGTSKLRYSVFSVYSYTGGLIWVLTCIIIGYYLGESWKSVFPIIHGTLIKTSIFSGLLIALIIVIKHLCNRGK
jgi:membrane protein DedA with SNARE-associated domain